jgi:hypothetical protein
MNIGQVIGKYIDNLEERAAKLRETWPDEDSLKMAEIVIPISRASFIELFIGLDEFDRAFKLVEDALKS